MREIPVQSHSRGLLILSPLLVFFLVYVGTSLTAGDFYKMPVTVAFLAATVWAFIVSRPKKLHDRVETFSSGAAHSNIMTMVWIFIMAGAFAQSARYIGAVDATVQLTLSLLPAHMLVAGIFLAACIISLAMGTSVGTIVAIMPVAAGLSKEIGADTALMAGAVIGGAFFGDNLSFISDTTIAATRTQGCQMRDKFRANFIIVLPAAIICLLIYLFWGQTAGEATAAENIAWPLVIPYFLVLGTALCGVNVMAVLALGLLSTGTLACIYGHCDMMSWAESMGKGIQGMGELIIVTLLAGGMLELIRFNGGLSYIIRMLTSRVKSTRGAEFCIAIMVSFANLCTANNTVAIVTVGNIAQKIAARFNIAPARCASLLDTFSCMMQGVIPYGAQLLMGAALAGIGTFEIIPYLFYPVLIGLSATIFIIFLPRFRGN